MERKAVTTEEMLIAQLKKGMKVMEETGRTFVAYRGAVREATGLLEAGDTRGALRILKSLIAGEDAAEAEIRELERQETTEIKVLCPRCREVNILSVAPGASVDLAAVGQCPSCDIRDQRATLDATRER